MFNFNKTGKKIPMATAVAVDSEANYKNFNGENTTIEKAMPSEKKITKSESELASLWQQLYRQETPPNLFSQLRGTDADLSMVVAQVAALIEPQEMTQDNTDDAMTKFMALSDFYLQLPIKTTLRQILEQFLSKVFSKYIQQEGFCLEVLDLHNKINRDMIDFQDQSKSITVEMKSLQQTYDEYPTTTQGKKAVKSKFIKNKGQLEDQLQELEQRLTLLARENNYLFDMIEEQICIMQLSLSKYESVLDENLLLRDTADLMQCFEKCKLKKSDAISFLKAIKGQKVREALHKGSTHSRGDR